VPYASLRCHSDVGPSGLATTGGISEGKTRPLKFRVGGNNRVGRHKITSSEMRRASPGTSA